MRYLSLWIGAFATLFSSCRSTNWELPKEYLGEWESGRQMVVLRTYIVGDGFNFIKDTARISILIEANKTASGNIGNAVFKNAVIEKNPGNVENTRVAYKIICEDLGKIYPQDPYEKKEIQIWLMPINGSLEAELRYTEGMSLFPMAGIRLVKKN